MKHAVRRVLCALGLCLGLTATANVTLLYWTGMLPTGWRGGAVPVGDGSEAIFFGPAFNTNVNLSGSGSFAAVLLGGGDQYTIDAPFAVTLTLGGLSQADNFGTRLYVQPNVTINVAGGLFDVGNGSVVLRSNLTGAGPLTLLGNSQGAFIFNSVAGGNNYTGNTTVGDGTNAPTVAFWDSTPFGAGTVTFLNGGTLISHNSAGLANSLVFNSTGSTNALVFRATDDQLVLSGAVTLANNANFIAQTANTHRNGVDGSGSYPVPGPMLRNPVVFTGAIAETGGARSVTVNGQGFFIFNPAAVNNTYSGGTLVNGTLVFGNNNAIPAAGTITTTGTGYVGLGDVSSGNFAAQIAAARFDKAAGGAVGLDTLPGNSTVTYGDDINLSATGPGATGFTNGAIRLGTATSAILTGTLTPQGTNYQFGNGGGTLYVQSSLGDSAYTGNLPRGVQVNNSGSFPLKLFLQGANSYSNNTTANNGIVVFDGPSSVPATGTLAPGGTSTFTGNSYIGYTDIAGVNGGSTFGSDPSGFLARFNAALTWGIVGFDTHGTNATANISSAIDLTGFNDGVFLGTSTRAILSGVITPSTVGNVDNTANTYRFTAANNGSLTLDSVLTDGGSARSVLYGVGGGNPGFGSGTITIDGNNTYTGGTVLNGNASGLTLVANQAQAFGAGGITVLPNASYGLQAGFNNLNLTNSIALPSGVNGGGLVFTGANALTLSGAISGGDASVLILGGAANPTLNLSGNNSSFLGSIMLNEPSTLNILGNTSAGLGTIGFASPGTTLAFGGAATAPTLYGIKGAYGSIILPNGTGTVLTVDTSNGNTDAEFGGVISGAAGGATDAALAVTSTGSNSNVLYLYGHNLYGGGTTISGNAALGLGFSDSAGSGPVTIAAAQGGLILNTGVTFTNPMVLNTGGLAGLGTFANSGALSGAGQTAGQYTFGPGQLVFPGIPEGAPGKLTLQANVVFGNGGVFIEQMNDPGTLTTLSLNGGTGLLEIQGNLDLSLLGTSGFLIQLHTLDANNDNGYSVAIIPGVAYSVPLIQTSGSIVGFNAGNFMVDASKFQMGIMSGSDFTLTADANHLYLNFTAVPEPSTWALLATGGGLLGLAAWRRRRAA